jgi:hypothetical protein
MAAVAAIAGFGMMVCCSSSVAALMMGGEEETPDTSAGAGAGAGSATPTDPRRDESTPANDFAGGSMIHLDRHTVDCGDDGLTGFSLDMEGTDKMLYNYKCRDGIDGTLEAEKDTGSNDWGSNNVIYLDRHTLDCGKKPIAKFKLERPASNKIMYKYTCNATEATGACRDVDVVSTVTGKRHKTDTLMEADPQCESDEVLTKFKHYRANPDTSNEVAAYSYKCCKM